MARRLTRRYRTAQRVLVITAAALITAGLARLCVDSWAAVERSPAPTFDLLVGAAAATGACAIAAWSAVVVVVIALTALPGRLGVTASRLSGAIAPVSARRRAQVALGLTVTAAHVGLIVAPAAATDPPSGAIEPRTSSVSSTLSADVDDLPPIGRPRVPPPSVVIPVPDTIEDDGQEPLPPETIPGPDRGPSDRVSQRSSGREHVTVEPGDTLWAIAADHLDDPTPAAVARAWPLWFAANRDVIGPDPDHIRPGMVLTAPVPSADSVTRTDR